MASRGDDAGRRCCFKLRNLVLVAIVSLSAYSVLSSFGALHHYYSYSLLPLEDQHYLLSAAICVQVKSEEAYLDEWVDYHHGLGFSHIYIYDNSDDFEMEQWGTEKRAGKVGGVTVKHFPGEGMQSAVYADCARTFGQHHTWLAFFDPDEFLELKQHDTVVQFLKDHCERGALSINWIIHGTSGRQVYEPKPVTLRFPFTTNHDGRVHDFVKSIVYVQDLDLNKPPHPHYPHLKRASGRLRQFFFHRRRAGVFQKDTSGRAVRNSQHPNGPSDVAVMHHYWTKSLKEYIAKRKRGISTSDGQGGSAGPEEHKRKHLELIQQAKAGFGAVNGTLYNDAVWQALKQFHPRYAAFEQSFAATTAGPYPSNITNHKETAAICCYTVDEEAYLDEWVDYHYAVGFSHIYIYDGSERWKLKQWGDEKGKHVTVKRGVNNKSLAYVDCARTSHHHTWMVFSDVDEFLLLKRHNHVVDFLFEYCKSGTAIAISKVVFGTSGRRVYEPKPVTKRFQHRIKGWDSRGKTIVQMGDMNVSSLGPTFGTPCFDTNRREIIGTLNQDGPTDVAVIHHYLTKSFKEFDEKQQRINASGGSMDSIHFKSAAQIPNGTIFDDSLWKAVKKYNPRYAIFDQDLVGR